MADRASLTSALMGRYEIEREVGAGGMATVYLARDVRHARQVALKVLHPELAAALGPERFLAEIRTTANLQHPHILPLHDSGEADGFLYYVMPFVAGESLRHRLERETQLPIDDAIRIAREMLSALDYAHRHGVVHRDIKPENILLHDGAALVADFGIALAVQSAGGQRMTQTGLSLGTPQYMSPEQAMGEKHIDGRADVYATGAVLYEMLTGEPPFSGASVQAIVAKVMTERPMSPRTVRETVPEHVEVAVMHALAKLPADRFATAKDFAEALDGRGFTSVSTGSVARAQHTRLSPRRILPWIAAGILGVLLGGTLAWRAKRGDTEESLRFAVEPPPGLTMFEGNARHFRLSNDGRVVLFTAGARAQLFLRRLNELQATPLAGIQAVYDFSFSPDGQWVAYITGNSSQPLKKIRVGDTQESNAQVLVAENGPQQFVWTRDHDIIGLQRDTLFSISSNTGQKRTLAVRDSSDVSWGALSVIDRDRIAAFRAAPSGPLPSSVGFPRIVSLDGGPVAHVELEATSLIAYRDGYLFYGAKDGRIMGVRFDLSSRKVRGEAMPLLDNVAVRPLAGISASLADNGTLAYLTGGSTSEVVIVDDHGAILSTLPIEKRKFNTVNWSPDGTRVLLQSGVGGQSDLWVYDTLTRVSARLTRGGEVRYPTWTPDSKRVAYYVPSQGRNVVVWMPADGSAPAEPIAAAKAGGPFSLSPDGKYVIVFSGYPGSGFKTPDVAFPLAGGDPIPLLDGIKSPTIPHVSPDGRWMAYSSEEGERREIYVRPFPSGAGRLQISTVGGSNPWWSHDGKRLSWRANGSIHRATLDLSGAVPRLVRDDSLFADVYGKDYSDHPDDRRFALLRDTGEGAKLVIVTHWLEDALTRLRAK